jgi:uncharacterized protein (TIGR02145 family)
MKHLSSLIILLLLTHVLFSQNEKVVIEGAIVVSDNDDANPVAGTIKWDGSDFLGFNGTEWVSLTCCNDSGPPMDCNGNSYQTVVIGDQTWFAENLRANCYNDGTPIPWAFSDPEWAMISPQAANSGDAGVYPGFGNDSSNGALYNWFVADSGSNGGKNVCPSGWHVPTDADYQELILFLDSAASGTNLNSNIAGGMMKTTGTIQAGNGVWDDPNFGATNSSGFSAEPNFSRQGPQSTTGANYWTQDLSGGTPPIVGGIGARGRFLSNTHGRLSASNNPAGNPNHIRCVKD